MRVQVYGTGNGAQSHGVFQMTPEQESTLSKLEAGTHVLVPVGPTADSVDSVCLSFNHSFGLMSRPEKQRCRYVASMWLRAWVKEARYGTLKSVQEGE